MEHRSQHLSGSEQQRVAICPALANGPSLLVADGPTGDLDPTRSREVFEMLREVAAEERVAIPVATHDPELASSLDRPVRLEEGCLA